MTIKTFRLLDLEPILAKLADADISLKMAICIAKDIEAFAKPLEIINKKRSELLNQYAVKDENGNVVYADEEQTQIKIQNPAEFYPKWQEMLNTDLDIDFKPLDMEALGNENIKMSAKEYLVLDAVFGQKEEAEKVSEDEVEVLDKE